MNISQISRPGPGQTISIHAAASDKIILGFSIEGITLSRDDSALIFTFYDGAAIRLDDFYENYHADNIPKFEADGRLVSGTEFFSALGPDLIPAAGPAPVERSHSAQAYGDSDLLGGVDHLDGLDMSGQGKTAADGGMQFDSALVAAQGTDFGGNPDAAGPDAPIPAPPLFPAGPFVRAVLYSPGNSADPVTTTVFFGGNGASPVAVAAGDIDFAGSAPGAQYAVAISLPAGWSTSWVDVSFDNIAGRLEFRLTADGVAEMQRLGLAGESLVDFIHVTVTDRASGDTFEYNVEFVATDNQNFDSAAHDSQYGGQHLDNIGEFHQGQNNGGAYSVISSAQNDEIIMNDTVIGGSSIHASGSADPAHMADDYNTINLNAGVVNTTQGSITHITSSDGKLVVADGVTVQGSGAENVIDMGKGSVHVQNASGNGVSAADGGKNTVSGGEVVVDAGDTGLFAKDGGSNTVGAQNGDVSIDGHQWGIVAQDNATNSVSATGGSVNITSGGQALQAQGGSANSVTTTDGDITINALWEGVAAYDNSTNNLSATNGSVSIKTDTWGISSTVNSRANVDVVNGNLEIDAIGRGVHAYDGSINTVSVTNGDVNINAGWEGLMAHFGGTNNIDVAGGSVFIDGDGGGIYSYSESANNLTVTDGSLHITSKYAGARAEENSVNTVAVTDGDISIQATSNGARVDGLAAARNGSNVLSATGGAVNVDVHSGSGAAVGMGADADGVNGVAASNRITAGEVTVSSSSDSSWTIGMYAANNNTVNEAENSIDTTGATAQGQSGNVSVHANWDAQNGPSGSYEAHAVAAYGKNAVNRITAAGDVDIKAGSSGNVATGLIARYESDNVIDGQKDISVSAVSTAHQAAALRVDTGGHNSLATKGTVDISATGSTASGMAVNSLSGPGYLVSGSNSVTSGEKTTITATATGSTAGSNAYGMVINYNTGNDGNASNTIISGDAVAINSSSASGNAYGMAVMSSGTATVSATNTINAEGRVEVNATGNVASAMHATGAQAVNSITTTSGNVTVNAAGTGSGIGSGFGYGMNARDSGGNSITTGSGDVKMSGNSASTSGYGIFANSSGSNTVATTSGKIDVSGSGATGYGMHATTSGTNNDISTERGDVSISGNAANGSGYGMSATISGSNSISTENGNVKVSGNATSGNAVGMSAVSSGSNTITTEGGAVAVSGSGTSAGSGMSASSGSNAITTTASGDVTVTGNATSSVSHGMYANSTGSSNAVNTENGDVKVSGTGTIGHGMYAASSGSNAVSTEGGNVTVSGSATGPSGSSFGYGMYATAGHNSISTEGGNVTVTGSGKSGYGMHASSGSNAITTDGGNITVTGQAESYGYGMYASDSGHNTIETQGGSIAVTSSGSGSGMHAVYATGAGSTNTIKGGLGSSVALESAQEALSTQSGGKNIIAGGDVSVRSTASSSTAVYATGSASENSVDALQSVAITSNMHGVSANSGGRNSIKGDDITIEAGNNANAYGVYAKDVGSTNEIAARSGQVTISAGKHALFAEAGGKNTVTGDGGMRIEGAESGLYALGSGSTNTITANGGGVAIEAANSNSYAMRAENKGVNTVVGAEAVTVGGGKFGMHAVSEGQNSITGNAVDISATNNALYANGGNSKNIVNAGNGAATLSADSAVSSFLGAQNTVTGASVDVNGTTNGLFTSGTKSGNTVTTGAAGTISITAGQRAMHAESSGSNKVESTDGNVTVTGQSTGSANGYGMSATSSGSNSITTDGGHVTVIGSGKPGHGMHAESSGSNTITTKSGQVTVAASSSTGQAEGMYALSYNSTSSNAITTDGGHVTVSANGAYGYGMKTDWGGNNNTITTKSGEVSVSGSGSAGNGYGMYAHNDNSNNSIITESGNVTVTGSSTGSADSNNNNSSGSGYGMYTLSGSNSITTDSGNVTVSGNSSSNSLQCSYGMYLSHAGGSNSITTKSGDVSVSGSGDTGGGSGIYNSHGTTSIKTENGNVTISASSNTYNSVGIDNYDGNMTITTESGNVRVSSSCTGNGNRGVGMKAFFGSSNISTDGGDVTVEQTSSAGYGWGMYAGTSGSNSITTKSGNVNVSGSNNSGTDDGTGMTAYFADSSNSITTESGKVSVTGSSNGGTSYGMQSGTSSNNVNGSNSITTDSGEVNVTASGTSAYGMFSYASSHNSITTKSGAVNVSGNSNSYSGYGMVGSNSITTEGGNVSVSGSGGSGAYGMSGNGVITTGSGAVNVTGSASTGIGYGMLAFTGSGNTITTESGHVSISGSGGSGAYGVAAKGGGVNTIESTNNSPLTVTITASAGAAEKAIAMWADGGGSVNRITGHSQAGGTGDSITLTASNGQGVAMQAANGGKNIITTGAGNDSVTIKGKIVGDGNEINLGGGSNVLTVNGAVEPGSLNVIVAGGTYTLILQESDTESFAVRYGAWLNGIGTNGLSSIHFEGWDDSALSAAYLADFMASFEGLLNTLHNAGVVIEPQALLDYLTSPSPASSPAALIAETGAEHHMQEAQHAFGHDDTQDSPVAAHDGPIFMTGDDSPQATFSAQTDSTVVHAGGLEADDIAQPGFAEGEHEVGPALPLFAFLHAPAAGMPTDMAADEGDESLHDGYLDNGECGGGITGLHAAITLTHGDESLDSLFAGTDQQTVESGEAGLWYVESGSDLHDVALTDMNMILVHEGPGEHAVDAPVVAEERTPAAHEVVSAPTVMDSSQEATDSAAREMANC